MEFAAWAVDGRFQDIIPSATDSGISWIDNPNSDAVVGLTAGSGFQDYKIRNITIERVTVFYDCCPNAPFPELMYEVSFTRSSNYYLYKLIIPLVLLTFVRASYTSLAAGPL